MSLRPLVATLRSSDPRAYLGISRDWRSTLRLHFLYAAFQSGLLAALREPRPPEVLARELDVVRPEILEALLGLGVSLGELRRRGGRIGLKGRRSRALGDPRNDSLVAMVQANVTYYNASYRHLAPRMFGAPLGEEAEGFGPLVARLSRIAEPYVTAYLEGVLRGRGAVRALDVGCGSGVYLKCVLDAEPGSTAVGIDVDPSVVCQARENLRRWALEDRATVVEGDGADLPSEVRGAFDVILLLSIVYYLDVPERLKLLRTLRGRMAEGGVLVLSTSCRGRNVDPFSANLNVATSSMKGLTPLPTTDEMEAQLRTSGFDDIRRSRLLPGASFYGFTAV